MDLEGASCTNSHPPVLPPVQSSEHGIQPSSETRGPLFGYFLNPPENSFWNLHRLQHAISEIKLQYIIFEDTTVKKIKDGLMIVCEHPALASGATIFSGLLLMRGPRRILWRQTLGRFQSEEAQLCKIDLGLKELSQSVEKLNKESKNMLLRASFGEEELQRGRTKIRDAGKEIQRLVKSIYHIESQAADLIDGLRASPGRNALKLRAEVASISSDLRQQRRELDKKILKISEYGVPV